MNNKEDIIEYLNHYYKIHKKSPIINENHPFTYNTVKKLFKTWNNALTEANLPVNRNEILYLKCKLCNVDMTKQYKEIKKSINDFCSHKCAATYNNTGRVMSDETKVKLSAINKGKKLPPKSEETKQKMRKPKTEAHKKAISDARKAKYAIPVPKSL